MIINTDAIVLKTFSYGETSLISRCFTKHKGKISFIIKGAKSKKNLISPYFQPLSFINIIYKENEKENFRSYLKYLLSDMDSNTIVFKKNVFITINFRNI